MTNYGFLSTYPPTECGLATFTAALRRHLIPADSGDTAGVVQVLDSVPPVDSPLEVVARLIEDDPGSAAHAAKVLNDFDAVVVQHEYGIYGGQDGEDLLPVLDALTVPTIAVLHTVLARPTPNQRLVLEQVIHRAAATVVMSQTAAWLLVTRYLVDPARIVVIPHGATVRRGLHSGIRRPSAVPTILTWGLLDPGKGIEWAIDAVGMLHAEGLQPRYLICGRTHPKVLARDGEAYRDSLQQRARQAGVAHAVRFDPTYRDPAALSRVVADADVVLLPYNSTEQVTSAVLIEAVASGRPVVATDFPHAAELLSGGAGLVVPHRDPPAIADALRRVLTEPGPAERMSAGSARLAPDLNWHAVAGRYRALAESLIREPVRRAA